jgi:putative membrane protein
MRHDQSPSAAARPKAAAPLAAGPRISHVPTAPAMGRILLAGLGFAWALPAAAQIAPAGATPQQAVTQELEQAGFTNIQIAPDTFVLHATDRAGRAVTMIVDPAATPALPPGIPPVAASVPAANASTRLTDQEKQFLVTAAQSSSYESALSTMAVNQAAAAAVKQYARQAVGDHLALDQTLQEIARANGVSLPQAPSPDQQIQLSTFAGLTGSGFDHTYLQEMARIETLNKRTYDLEASLTTSPALKSFAQAFAPAAAQRAHEALVLNVMP